MRTQGIVIKKREIGEYDELVTLYTHDFGKITAIVKSIAKPESKQASHLDIFNLVDFSLVYGNGHPIIASALSQNTFTEIKKSLPAVCISSFLIEVVDKAVYENDPDAFLWSFLINSLRYLNDSKISGERDKYFLVFSGLQKKLLEILGYHDIQSVFSELDFNIFEKISQKNYASLQLIKTVLKC